MANALILTLNGYRVQMYLRDTEICENLNNRRRNTKYLSEIQFPKGVLTATTNINHVFENCSFIIVALPSAYVENTLEGLSSHHFQGKIIVSAVKGILKESNMLLNDYLVQKFNLAPEHYVALTGPCHAEEVAQRKIAFLTFSGLDASRTKQVAGMFANKFIKTICSHDVWGAQFAAALKNVYSLGAGIVQGMNLGDNFLSVFVTACNKEMKYFLEEHFKKYHPSDDCPVFEGSAYLGDLIVTAYSIYGRNRRFGDYVGKGYSVESTEKEMGMLAEGYYASRGMHHISQQTEIELPIATIIYQMLWDHLSRQKALLKFMKHLHI